VTISLSKREELAVQARYLRNAAPQQFLIFTAAFSAYTLEAYDLMVQTSGNLPQAQGRAQQCKAILDILEGVKNG
jgi:hypothetical protein